MEEEGHRSAFHGKIQEIPQIRVDNFEDDDVSAYFVSHMHSDHTKGLYGSTNSWNLKTKGPKIYMSEKSAVHLRHNHYKYKENLLDIVEPLRTGFTYTIEIPNGTPFQVTLIPVTHMVGAVMFLFKTADKTILYTGDFVVEEDEISNIIALHNKDQSPIHIDKMYVDATFDNPRYEEFPRREDCHSEMVDLAWEWLADDNHRLVLTFSYRFAYEDLFRALHKALGIQVYIHTDKEDDDVLEMYRDLFSDRFVTDDRNSRIHVCVRNKNNEDCPVRNSHAKEYRHVNISAMGRPNYRRGQPALQPRGNNSYHLCYPSHCSRKQLHAFISHFTPTKKETFPQVGR